MKQFMNTHLPLGLITYTCNKLRLLTTAYSLLFYFTVVICYFLPLGLVPHRWGMWVCVSCASNGYLYGSIVPFFNNQGIRHSTLHIVSEQSLFRGDPATIPLFCFFLLLRCLLFITVGWSASTKGFPPHFTDQR